ncbi:HK97 family phage prohead protease [Sporosarcina soli]|uniref:HK97 family phage prohead protease n=1 Tax=Sporosarcina soli TaxID=334736 RepID=A0ABW0TG23_9BACL
MKTLKELARELLQKSAAPTLETKRHIESSMRIKEYSQEDMTIKGYASTFGGEPDAHGDVVVSGAFKKTLITRSGRIKFLVGHDWNQIVGKIVHAKEDEKGLYIEAKIVDTVAGKDLMKLVDAGVIDRMSIGFVVKDYEWDDDGIFYIKEADLYEVSAVGLPANDRAHIQKSIGNEDVNRLVTLLQKAIDEAVEQKVKSQQVDDPQASEQEEKIKSYLDQIKSLTAN